MPARVAEDLDPRAVPAAVCREVVEQGDPPKLLAPAHAQAEFSGVFSRHGLGVAEVLQAHAALAGAAVALRAQDPGLELLSPEDNARPQETTVCSGEAEHARKPRAQQLVGVFGALRPPRAVEGGELVVDGVGARALAGLGAGTAHAGGAVALVPAEVAEVLGCKRDVVDAHGVDPGD